MPRCYTAVSQIHLLTAEQWIITGTVFRTGVKFPMYWNFRKTTKIFVNYIGVCLLDLLLAQYIGVLGLFYTFYFNFGRVEEFHSLKRGLEVRYKGSLISRLHCKMKWNNTYVVKSGTQGSWLNTAQKERPVSTGCFSFESYKSVGWSTTTWNNWHVEI